MPALLIASLLLLGRTYDRGPRGRFEAGAKTLSLRGAVTPNEALPLPMLGRRGLVGVAPRLVRAAVQSIENSNLQEFRANDLVTIPLYVTADRRLAFAVVPRREVSWGLVLAREGMTRISRASDVHADVLKLQPRAIVLRALDIKPGAPATLAPDSPGALSVVKNIRRSWDAAQRLHGREN